MKRSGPIRLLHRSQGPATQAVRLPEPAGTYSDALFLAVPLSFAMILAISLLTGWSPSPASWFIARSTGLMLYLLFWATVVIGLLLTVRLFGNAIRKSTLLSLHTYVSRLAYGFLVAHLLSLFIDRHVPFSVEQMLVPFRSPVAEPWTGFGVLAMYLFVVIAVSATLRRYVPFTVWRFLHVFSFPMFALSFLHGIGTGSDIDTPILKLMYAVTAAIVLALCALRLSLRGTRTASSQQPFADPHFEQLAHYSQKRPVSHRMTR